MEDTTGEIKVDSFNFIWEIQEFEDCCEKVGEKICSPCFKIRRPADASHAWHLVLFPFGQSNVSKNYVSVFLHSAFYYHVETKVNITMSVINQISNEDTNASSCVHTFEGRDKTGYGFACFISREKLMCEKDSLLVDGNLLIKCSVHLISNGEEDLSRSSYFNHFQDLLTSGQFSDITIQVGRRKIKAHKNILAARSQTFADLIKKVKQEEDPNVIKISDFTYEVMKELLSFVYCEKVDNLQQLKIPLLQAAHKYKVDRLKIMCAKILQNSLSDDNAVETLNIASSSGCLDLKSKAMDYIIENLRDITHHVSFRLLKYQNPTLLEEILCKSVSK